MAILSLKFCDVRTLHQQYTFPHLYIHKGRRIRKKISKQCTYRSHEKAIYIAVGGTSTGNK